MFQPKGGITLIESESELNEVEEWLQYQALGVAVVPIFSNGEGDYIGVFTDDILKGKVMFLDHDNPHFAPRFRSLESFIKQIAASGIQIDWNDPDNKDCDYPNHAEQPDPADRDILLECWNRIEKADFLSETNRELIVTTTMYLTPVAELNTLVSFLDDKNRYIADRAMWLLGVFHKYEPAKERISNLLDEEEVPNHIREKYYNGELVKKSIWKKLFGK
ncbi:MAG: hypothetical protein LUE98_15315 [Tannerellaceae bacterium]|nr:hypothetical protein [Tannerellaceae bacterium]